MQWLPHGTEAASTTVAGIFVQEDLGWVNLAQCLGAPSTFCATSWPAADGEYVIVEPFRGGMLGGLNSRWVGDTVDFGPWSIDYVDDQAIDLGYYFRTWDIAEHPAEALDVELGGVWGSTSASAVLEPAAPIAVTSHDPFDDIPVVDSEPLPLRWTAGDGSAEIFLAVLTEAEQRLYLLDDDGAYDLDLSGLGLVEGDPVDLLLGRWSRGELPVEEHRLTVVHQSNQWLHGTFREVADRDELAVWDTCELASGQPPVPPGSYTGDFSGTDYNPDYSPGAAGNPCTGFPANGTDAVFPVLLQPDELLTVDYRLVADDASVYVQTSCGSPPSCVAGADETVAGDVETASYFNATGAPQTVWVVLDAYAQVTDLFTVDLSVESLPTDVLKDSCVEAMDQGPIGTGSYVGTLSGYLDLLDPYCATPAGGGEGLLMVELLPGEELTATVDVTGADPKLYLMYNCGMLDSCLFVEDQRHGTSETLIYLNANGYSEQLYLVVDGELFMSDYFLDITIQ